MDDLMALVDQIVPYDMTHHAGQQQRFACVLLAFCLCPCFVPAWPDCPLRHGPPCGWVEEHWGALYAERMNALEAQISLLLTSPLS